MAILDELVSPSGGLGPTDLDALLDEIEAAEEEERRRREPSALERLMALLGLTGGAAGAGPLGQIASLAGGTGLGGIGSGAGPLATGSIGGTSQSRGDMGLWQGGEAVLPSLEAPPGSDWAGPVIRRSRLTPDAPFQVPPVAGADFVSSYGAPRDGGARQHQGNDLMAGFGTPNYATFGGELELQPGQGSAGNSAYVTNPRLGTSVYFHLDEFAKGLESGQRVRPGEFIGTVGDTGNAEGGPPHTHFEYRPGGRSAPAVNPWGELNEIIARTRRATRRHRPGLARYPESLARELGGLSDIPDTPEPQPSSALSTLASLVGGSSGGDPFRTDVGPTVTSPRAHRRTSTARESTLAELRQRLGGYI